VNNLVPGTAYTLNVLARGQAGYLSLPSTPVTFTTSTPSSSTCQVSYAVTQGWGNGFVANISITNSGPDPIDGWTLAFSFPAASESVSSDWNGTWTETGQAVTVTSLSWNGTLAADVATRWTSASSGPITGHIRHPRRSPSTAPCAPAPIHPDRLRTADDLPEVRAGITVRLTARQFYEAP
jgi:Cellulose binding domain